MENKNQKNIFHRRLDYDYPKITHGKGIYLYDEKGKEYIDGCGGALVVNIGHGIEEIAHEAKRLAKRFSYLHGSQFSTIEMEEYAKELCEIAPNELNKVFFVSGGSESAESAVKLARQYHYDAGNKKKYKIIFRKPGYHGSTIGLLPITGKESFKKIPKPYLRKFPWIPAPFCYHCPFKKDYPDCNLECAWQLEKMIKKQRPETISCFIMEPIIGSSAGAVTAPKKYFEIVRKICDKYNVLLIFDEIMCGFGRTGKWFTADHYGVSPDIMIVSKGIGGGLVPLAAVFCIEKIVDIIRKGSGNFSHGFTFENNPFTTGIGRAVLKYIKKHNLIENCAQQGRYLLSQLELFKEIDIVGDVRGMGLMTAVEFVKDKKTREPFSRKKKLGEKIVQIAMKKGLNLYFSLGFLNGKGDAVMIAPPFIIAKEEIDKILKIFKETVLGV